jgi:hypothetical protein
MHVGRIRMHDICKAHQCHLAIREPMTPLNNLVVPAFPHNLQQIKIKAGEMAQS